jgi:hypothetical protein
MALSEQDWAILGFLNLVGLATTTQLWRRHFADHATAAAGQWATRQRLRHLVGLGLIRHLERRIGGVRAGSAALVWYLTRSGQRVHDPGRRLSYRFGHEPSGRLVDHSLAITETVVRLVEAERGGAVEVLRIQSEPECWRAFLGPHGQPRRLRPDLLAVTSLAGSQFEDWWFVEVDRGTETLTTITRKASVYEDYRRSGLEQQRSGVFPRVVWITPDQGRAGAIQRALGHDAGWPGALHTAATLDGFIALVGSESESGLVHAGAETPSGTAAATAAAASGEHPSPNRKEAPL